MSVFSLPLLPSFRSSHNSINFIYTLFIYERVQAREREREKASLGPSPSHFPFLFPFLPITAFFTASSFFHPMYLHHHSLVPLLFFSSYFSSFPYVSVRNPSNSAYVLSYAKYPPSLTLYSRTLFAMWGFYSLSLDFSAPTSTLPSPSLCAWVRFSVSTRD